MSKQYNIRWTPDDSKELNKAVKNFNAKITRLTNKYPELASKLPKKASASDLKDLIDTRQDLKRELNALKRFSSKKNVISKNADGKFTGIVVAPDNDYNVKITKWQRDEMRRRIPYINKRRAKEYEKIKDIPVTSGGKKQGYTKGELGMSRADLRQYDPITAFTPSKSKTEIDMHYEYLQKQSQYNYYDKRKQTLRENYIKGIKENYDSDDPQIAQVIKNIEGMEFEDFYKKFLGEDEHFEISSPKTGRNPTEELKEGLISAWAPELKPTKKG